VLAVTGVPGEPSHFYFGSVNGGVWETFDAGRTWKPIFDGQPVGTIGAIAVAPSNPAVLYAGSGEADMRSDIAQGDGIYKSTDRGKTWTNVGLRDSQQIARILVHPSNPDFVYAAALGHPYGPNAERGVFRSMNGGATWQKLLGSDSVGAVDLAFEPGNPDVIYAAMWATRRPPWSIYQSSTGPGGGLFKSTDGGNTFLPLTNGLPANPGRIGIALSPALPKRVYAMVDAESGAGLYRSDDAGATFTQTSNDGNVSGRGWYFGGITVEPKNADVVYASNISLYRSGDAGKSFVCVRGAPGGDDYHILWIDPNEPQRRILGADQGCVISLDGGTTWSSWYNQPTAQFYHVATDNRYPYWVYGPQQDSAAAALPSHTDVFEGIVPMDLRRLTVGSENDNIAPDPRNPSSLFGGRVDHYDEATQQTQSLDPTMAYPHIDRHTWTLPLSFSHRDPRVLYFSNQRLYRTEDGGAHWTVISPDLTRERPGIPPNLDPATAALLTAPRPGVIYAIAPSRTADRDLWVGTDDGLIWRTRDEGAHWTDITPPALTAWSKVGIIETSYFDPETAYVAIDRHRLEDFKPYIYRTHDGGKTWTLIANGLPTFVNAVREDPVRRGLLYAATERGVSVSFDDGASWQSLQLNLPVTSMRDLVVHENDLVLATHGRGFWILDNVSPLRQTPSASGPFLFTPANAVREHPGQLVFMPMPKDEPVVPNPPFGAAIDYLLRAPAKLVTLEILDGAGHTIRTFSSNDPIPPPDPTIGPDWQTLPPILRTTPGQHRFYWSLHYPAPAILGGGDGAWALPGAYTAALTVDGTRLTQPLTVVPDPRVSIPPSAYAEQLAFTLEVEAMSARLAAALKDADQVIATTTGATRAKAIEISGDNPAPSAQWRYPLSTETLRFAFNQLGKLSNAAQSADRAPTLAEREGWATEKPVAEKVLAEWAAFKNTLPPS
jgi:photosystem II stability/assembly factor-like uncharacterized protein